MRSYNNCFCLAKMATLYLMGRRFLIRTHEKSLKFLIQQRMVGEEYQRWFSKLLGFEVDIQYNPEASNKVVDALSCKSTEVELGNLERICGIPWNQIRRGINDDDFIQRKEGDYGGSTAFGFYCCKGEGVIQG